MYISVLPPLLLHSWFWWLATCLKDIKLLHCCHPAFHMHFQVKDLWISWFVVLKDAFGVFNIIFKLFFYTLVIYFPSMFNPTIGYIMIGNSFLGSAIVHTSIYLPLISIDNHDPWEHWQELMWGRCGIPFKAKILQLGELNLIKQWCEIHTRWDRIHTMLATITTSFGSSMIVVPQ